MLYEMHYTGCETFSLMLRYDTVLRSWTTYVTQIGTPMIPYRRYLTKAASFITFQVTGTALDIMLLVRDRETLHDKGFAAGDSANYQFLDTGYRSHDPVTKKRYRSVEFRVNNLSDIELGFNTEFMVDDEDRMEMFQYTTELITDPEDPMYGWTIVDQAYSEPIGTAAVLPYNDSLIHARNKWILRKYKTLFDTTVSKIRFNVSGKGYAPRFKLRSFNGKPFELLSHGYVYRVQNTR